MGRRTWVTITARPLEELVSMYDYHNAQEDLRRLIDSIYPKADVQLQLDSSAFSPESLHT